MMDNDNDDAGVLTKQADVNGNGIGDVCDPHPL
jgi:hypothetical protein